MKATVYNEDCLKTIARLPVGSVSVVLTSPPYNTNVKAAGGGTTMNRGASSVRKSVVRYDDYVDVMSNGEYADWCVRIFNGLSACLKPNGVVLWNASYGSNNTSCMFESVAAIIARTPFTVADVIVWKKPSAIPNNMNPNRLTRSCEFVFVFARKDELATFGMNKKVVSKRKTGQANFENVYNFIEARNNDGECELNKATFSTELCDKLLSLYLTDGGGCVYDPFNGTGTTANACKRFGVDYVGSEISARQCEYTKRRVDDLFTTVEIVKEAL